MRKFRIALFTALAAALPGTGSAAVDPNCGKSITGFGDSYALTSPDGQSLVRLSFGRESGRRDLNLYRLDPETGRVLQQQRYTLNAAHDLANLSLPRRTAWLPQGQLAIGLMDRILIWDSRSGRLLNEISTSFPVDRLEALPPEKSGAPLRLLAINTEAREAYVLDLAITQITARLPKLPSTFGRHPLIEVTPDGQALMVGGSSQQGVTFWRLPDLEHIGQLEQPTFVSKNDQRTYVQGFLSFDVHAESGLVLSRLYDGSILLWRYLNGGRGQGLWHFTKKFRSARLSVDGQTMLLIPEDAAQVHVFDTKTGEEFPGLRLRDNEIVIAAAIRGLVVTGSKQGFVDVWDRASGQHRQRLAQVPFKIDQIRLEAGLRGILVQSQFGNVQVLKAVGSTKR
jgi:WD40 repeat protein